MFLHIGQEWEIRSKNNLSKTKGLLNISSIWEILQEKNWQETHFVEKLNELFCL